MMGFGEAVKTCLFKKYVTFSGRAPRSEFWWFQLFCLIVMVFVPFMADILFAGGNSTTQPSHVRMHPLYYGISLLFLPYGDPLLFVIFLAFVLPQLALFSRRLRDQNLSGLFCVFLLTYPIVLRFAFLAMMFVSFAGGGLIAILKILALIYGIPIFWLIIGLRRGTKGDNRFGADPLEAGGATE